MSQDSSDKNFAEMAPLVLASKLVVGENAQPVCYVFRTEINNEFDSGWHFWSGEEDQDFVDDLSNFTVCSLNDFLATDPTLKEILDKPIGKFWEREQVGDSWEEVEFEEDTPTN